MTKINHSYVQQLERLLEMARKGEVIGGVALSIRAEDAGMHEASSLDGDNELFTMIGMMSVVSHKLRVALLAPDEEKPPMVLKAFDFTRKQ
jgi:hypothetical protein